MFYSSADMKISSTLVTLDDLNCVFVGTDESSVHLSFNAKLLLQGFRVAVNQGVLSRCFVDVDLVILQVFSRTGGILVLTSTHKEDFPQVIFKVYLNEVDFIGVGKDSVHSAGHFLPCPGDWEGMKAVTTAVQAHVDGA